MSVVLHPPHPEEFTICPTCYRLQGQVAGRRADATQDRIVLVQFCGCVGSGGLRTETVPPRWPGYDFDEAWTLCYGCGAEVLASGSKWSVWFCESCKVGVRRLHEICGVAVIPVGRHSMMARFGVPGGGPLALAGQPRPDAQAIARFVDALRQLTGRMAHLDAWAPRAVEMNLAERGLAGTDPVPFPRYLSAFSRRPVDRRRRFEGLGRHFGVPEALIEPVVATWRS